MFRHLNHFGCNKFVNKKQKSVHYVLHYDCRQQQKKGNPKIGDRGINVR